MHVYASLAMRIMVAFAFCLFSLHGHGESSSTFSDESVVRTAPTTGYVSLCYNNPGCADTTYADWDAACADNWAQRCTTFTDNSGPWINCVEPGPGGFNPGPGCYQTAYTYHQLLDGTLVFMGSTYGFQGGWARPVQGCPENTGTFNAATGFCEKTRTTPVVDGNCSVSNPVKPGLGYKLETATDFSGGLTARRMALVRQYSSHNIGRQKGSLGIGWFLLPFDRKLLVAVDSSTSAPTKIQALRSGDVRYFFTPSNGQWVTSSAKHLRLTQTPSGWSLKDAAEGTLEEYTTDGRLVAIRYIDGQSQFLSYSTDSTPSTIAPRPGLLLGVTDDFNRTMSLVYDSSRGASAITVAGDSVYRYAYDPVVGSLSSVTFPDGNTRGYLYEASLGPGQDFPSMDAALPASGSRWVVWSPANFVQTASLPEVVRSRLGDADAYPLTGIIDENGDRYGTYTYDTNGKAVISEHNGGVEKYIFSYGNNQTTIIDPLGTQRTTSYTTINGTSLPIGSSQPAGSGSTACRDALTYDAQGNIASRTDFNGGLTTYSYDPARNLETQRVEGVGTAVQRTITTAWHPDWNLVAHEAAPLRRIRYVYNGQSDGDAVVSCAPSSALIDGQPIAVLCKTIEFATNDTTGAQGLSAAAVGLPRIRQYSYNEFGQLLTVVGPRTDVTEITNYSYDAQGNLSSITNAAGHVTTLSNYDASGRVGRIVDPNGLTVDLTYSLRGLLTSLNVGGEITTYDYDKANQLTQIVLPDNVRLNYSYDAAHRLTGISDGLGNSIAYTLDPMSNRIKEEIRDPGNQLSEVRRRVFDALNRVAQEIGAQDQAIRYQYDSNGNVTSVTDPLNRTTQSVYDALNRLTKITDPASGVTQYGYDGLDRLTQVSDPRSLVTSYVLDGLGNLTRQTSPDTGSTQNTYDAAGNLSTRTDAKGQSASYQYDALNRVTLVAYGDGKQSRIAYDQGTYGIGRVSTIDFLVGGVLASSIQYAYDLQGRIVSETRLVAGLPLTTAYSYTNGRMTGITYPSGRRIGYTLDGMGRVSQVDLTDQNQVKILASNIQYRPFGGVQSFINGAGQLYTRGFDQDGRITSFVLGTQTKLLGIDAGNRINSVTDAANAQNSVAYSYDSLDRLIGAVQPSTTLGYTYDSNGNRTTQTTGSNVLNYSNSTTSNQLLSINTAPIRNYSYDDNGSVASDGQNTWAYDSRGRLSQATTASGTVQYEVNAIGQRVRKSTKDGDTIYHYDKNGRLIAEASLQGNINREIVYLGDIPLAVIVENVKTNSVTATSLEASPNPAVTGQSVTLVATVSGSGKPIGSVTFTDGTTVLGTAPLNANGVAALQVASFAVGSHPIVASYSGDSATAGSVSTIEVLKVGLPASATTLTSSANPWRQGGQILLTATVTGKNPTGVVEFRNGQTSLGEATLSNGQAVLSVSSLPLGNNILVAQYRGDVGNSPSISKPLAQIIQSASPTTLSWLPTGNSSSGPNPSMLTQQAGLVAMLTGGSKSYVPSGTVTFKEGTTILGVVNVNWAASSNFVASLFLSTLSVGTHAITAEYSGDAHNNSCTTVVLNQVVNAPVVTTVTWGSVPQNPSVVGQPVSLSANIGGDTGNRGPTGTVTFKDGDAVLGVVPVSLASNGMTYSASLTVSNLSVGTHSLTASYSGDLYNTAGVSAALSQVVNDKITTSLPWNSPGPNPAIVGQTVTLPVFVLGGTGGNSPTGTVTFTDGSTVIGTSSLSVYNGMGQYSGQKYASITISTLNAGTHNITATYSGDSYNKPGASSVLSLVVNDKITTTLPWNSPGPNPAIVGQTVTLPVFVLGGTTSATSPTGTVTFTDGSTVIGTSSLSVYNGMGQYSGQKYASITTSTLSIGTHNITATYSGDTYNKSGTSSVVNLVVNDKFVTRLPWEIYSPNPSVLGQTVKLTVAVRDAGTGATSPTGTVTFFDGETVIGTSSLSLNTGPYYDGYYHATISINNLAVGTHNITASYSGDSYNKPSTSAAVSLVVNAASASLSPSLQGPQYATGYPGYFIKTSNGHSATKIFNLSGISEMAIPNVLQSIGRASL